MGGAARAPIWFGKGGSRFHIDTGTSSELGRQCQCPWLLKSTDVLGTHLVVTEVEAVNLRCPSSRNLRA